MLSYRLLLLDRQALSEHTTTSSFEFIPIQSWVARASGAPGNYAGHSSVPSTLAICGASFLMEAQHTINRDKLNSSVKRCRSVKDRSRLWKMGGRDRVRDLCCARHNAGFVFPLGSQ